MRVLVMVMMTTTTAMMKRRGNLITVSHPWPKLITAKSLINGLAAADAVLTGNIIYGRVISVSHCTVARSVLVVSVSWVCGVVGLAFDGGAGTLLGNTVAGGGGICACGADDHPPAEPQPVHPSVHAGPQPTHPEGAAGAVLGVVQSRLPWRLS